MLNGQFANEQAGKFAERLSAECPESLADQIRLGIRLTAGRQPDASELQQDMAFVEDLRTKYGLGPQPSLAVYSLMLLNTNEFVYLD
jgi:hypothetical protein